MVEHCERCGGKGTLPRSQQTCPECLGAGEIDDEEYYDDDSYYDDYGDEDFSSDWDDHDVDYGDEY